MFVLLCFLLLLAVFFLSFKLAESRSRTKPGVQAIGTKMLQKKERQFDESSIFGPLRKAIAGGEKSKAFLTIFPLMLLKSVAFYFVGLILILPLMLVVQGVIMGSLFVAYQKKYTSNALYLKVTYWQVASHLIVGAYGFVMGLKWLFEIDLLKDTAPQWLTGLFYYAALSVIWTVVAAFLEVKMLVRDNAVRKL